MIGVGTKRSGISFSPISKIILSRAAEFFWISMRLMTDNTTRRKSWTDFFSMAVRWNATTCYSCAKDEFALATLFLRGIKARADGRVSRKIMSKSQRGKIERLDFI